MDLNRHLRSLALLFFILTTHLNLSHSRHYNGIRHKRQHSGNIYLPESFIIPGGEDSNDEDWGPWGSPSECSRTCGGGVAYQTRVCYRLGQNGEASCSGGSKKYFSCNTQDCPDEETDFRKQQCSSFDQVPFEGVRYSWVPYTKSPNPCELNCMPIGERFYYRHKAKVIDGTRCNDESYNICVDGTCQPVGCDLMLGSEAREDKCRQCQGDGSACSTSIGDLEMNNLQAGYNDILLIPSGATNIEIYEKSPSNNYLAIRNLTGHYLLNGYYRIDFPRVLSFAGSTWHYERRPQGFAAPDKLTCMGPTTQALYLVLLQQEKNVGVHYEYSIPTKAAIDPTPDTYFWSYTDFAPCSASCGGGSQSRSVTCNSRSTLEEVEISLCDASAKPAEVQKCGTEVCAPHWSDKPWSKCSTPCGPEGTQEREVKCERISSDGIPLDVDDSVCLNSVGNKPATIQSCNQDLVCAQWHIGSWQPCDKLCGEGEQKRNLVCYRKENGKITVLTDADCIDVKPETTKKCIIKPCEGVDYVTSSWSGCSECGQTIETRTALCATKKGVVFDEKFCENRVKPELSRPCKAPACEYQWFTSQWSKCSSICGKGVQSRNVVCGKFDGEMIRKADDDSKCDIASKPENEKACEIPSADCPGQWFTGPWSDCSKKCGGGERNRKIFCIFNETVSSLKHCDEEKIEFATEQCNIVTCIDDELLPVDVTSKPIEVDDEGEEYCDEDESEDEDAVSDSSLEDTGVTKVMTSDSDALNIGISLDMENTGTTESSLLTDELMLSDSTFASDASSDEGITSSPGASTSDDEGSGTGSVSEIDARFAEGSGDDRETSTSESSLSNTSEPSDISSSATLASDDSLKSSQSSSGSSISSDSSSISSDVSSDVVTLSSISDASSASIIDTTTTSSMDVETTMKAESTTSAEDVSSSSPTTTETTSQETTTENDLTTSTDVESTSTSIPDTTLISSDILTTMAADVTTTESSLQSSDTVEDDDYDSSKNKVDSKMEETTSSATESSMDVSTATTDGPDSTTESDLSTPTLMDEATQTSDLNSATEVTELTEDVTSSSISKETGPTVSEATESTVFETTQTDVEGTTVDIWTTTSEGRDTSSVSEAITEEDEATTPNTIVSAISKEQKPRKCKPRPKIPACIKSTFGCCADNNTVATGPFDEGCPIAETCKETKYGCCPDEVSPAAGHKNKGCPKPMCEESLFGCCSDKFTSAEGQNNEGCPIEVTTVGGCAGSKFGCCPDGIAEATDKNNAGCAEEVVTLAPRFDESEAEIIDCTKSKYGCCSDETEATGPDLQGCKKVEDKSCDSSRYGCCDDNSTSATGPNKTGCSACLNEIFGCCPDNKTPAHGPHGEGCCLLSHYGCCPDNMNEARGPNLEGCGCEYSSYGCCPDNKTTALSATFDGCGCQYSSYGCCPDRITQARGEKYEGCPCEAFQFGCCPDGETAAKGPQNQGCHCSQSEFKCCSDGTTPARGPNFDGCTCATSLNGCCPDGVTDAQGKNFEGCENVPESPQKACSLKRDMGPCNTFTVKYFFDMEYGGCSRFWYGGCEGNNNRFETNQECASVCETPSGKDVCQLPMNTGPCKGYYPMFYFDVERNVCSQFIYGGCLGNTNRFETIEECKSTCAVDDSKSQCEQPKDEGPCQGAFERWHFDKENDRCEPFHYGGCKGNKNNFATEGSCKYACQTPGVSKASCDLPIQMGNCNEQHARWYFEQEHKKCTPFYYTGCEGNDNNYRSLEECEQQCPSPIEKDLCYLPAELGNCQNYTANWYYDTKESRCRQFYYGGCGGNGNNFPTEKACEQRCTEKRLEVPSAPHVETPPRFDEPEEDYCLTPKDVGGCDEYIERYYFDERSRACHQFTYTGCGGNHNNFESPEECQRNCGHLYHSRPEPPVTRNQTQSTDICNLPEQSGDCHDYKIAYFYDSDISKCTSFHYSGCGGNENNFETNEQCERQCGAFKGVDVCQQRSDPGRCEVWEQKYYFESHSRRCLTFDFGGCEGNGNRFESEQECEAVCLSTESPASTDNKAICIQPAERGECQDGNDDYLDRWYYEPRYQTCIQFQYSGCIGNRNNFRTFETCIDFCSSTAEEPEHDICVDFQDACRRLSCPYGIAKSYDPSSNCESCSCYDPCNDYVCPESTQCVIDIQANGGDGQTEFIPVCREIEKPGVCPRLANRTNCDRECNVDADCRGNYKCCQAGCSLLCVPPYDSHAVTHAPPVHIPGAKSPQLENVPTEEVNVAHEEGGVAVLRCFATGFPPPSITWKRGGLILNTNQGRFILTSTGDLKIVQLHRTDSGTYICVADNGIGVSVSRDVNLTVSDPVEREAYIIGEANTTMIVKLNEPATLRCLAGGFPKPSVYWWRGSDLMPLRNETFEIHRDYSLVFHKLQLGNLGKYLCEAYTGKGKPTTLTITLKTIGPVPPPIRREEEAYLKYVISPNDIPTTTTVAYKIEPEIPREPYPSIREPLPVETNIVLPNDKVTYDVGSELSLECEVSGYPKPSVVWFKDGRQIQTSDRIHITETHRLVVQGLTSGDAGNYRCLAKNEYSEAYNEKAIFVEGVLVPSNCTDNPFFANCQLIVQASYCKHKYYAVFCCRSCTLAGQLYVKT